MHHPARIAAPQHHSSLMPLPPPSVSRTLAHTRRVRFEAYKRADDLWDLEAHLTDIKPFDYRLSSGVRRGRPAGARHVDPPHGRPAPRDRRRARPRRSDAVPGGLRRDRAGLCARPRRPEPRARVPECGAGALREGRRLHASQRDARPVPDRRDPGAGGRTGRQRGRRLEAVPARSRRCRTRRVQAITPDYGRQLVGLDLGRGFRKAVQERFANVAGCTHLNEVSSSSRPPRSRRWPASGSTTRTTARSRSSSITATRSTRAARRCGATIRAGIGRQPVRSGETQ